MNRIIRRYLRDIHFVSFFGKQLFKNADYKYEFHKYLQVSVEIRVRYLSFMGIGRDVQTCGVIVHTARDDFQAHCFYSTPSSGALCKAIEAACVLRYQKCLDAHHTHTSGSGSGPQSAGSGNNSANDTGSTTGTPSTKTAANLAAAFKNVLASFGRAKSVEEKVWKFKISRTSASILLIYGYIIHTRQMYIHILHLA